jgi:two-component system alkaline phosphatase synthesis response regulator PhoP
MSDAIVSPPNMLAVVNSVGPAEESADQRATILIVEDDPTLLTTLSYNLRRSGFDVVTANDGESGLRVAGDAVHGFDLVVLDLMLPGISGYQMLRMLRRTSDVPVLILSARGEEQDKIDGLELGADDYIVKPFALREFIARVRAAVRRRSTPAARPPSVLQRGSIRIEPDRRQIFVNGAEVQLRPKEFGLLLALAMEPGKLFGRQELLDAIWGEDVIVDERTVDVHISWLRGKLTNAGVEGDPIKTVYGAGYRFHVQVNDMAGLEAMPTHHVAGRGDLRLDEHTG